ncbi:MAG TPA: anaerobic ribonucleoside-triphosphate reductase activating protein [Desulfobacteraceae bacterium]|nr:anaerobic ribonucleoside-triphosphate reductase activating protein [Desulfobacteraceae bacterium]|tara:strand:- start:1739 stop:2455 length:717 start_codon:yes stop_codon:yes gene_type:complete
MHIGGFQKNSLIDFPGVIACVVFTPGCNFTCPYCHNPELAAGPVTGTGSSSFTQEDVLAFLDKRKGMLQGVAITGGEPTLQRDLPEFIRQVRGMGYKVKLDSNGTRPGVLAELLKDGLVDYLAMDIKTDLAHYPMVLKNQGSKDPVDRIRQSIALIKGEATAYEFRTTCARPFITPEIMDQIGREISGAALYVLQKCSRNVEILDADFLKDEAHFFTDKEMSELKSIITPFVQAVKIR